jgi:hypothetical protein
MPKRRERTPEELAKENEKLRRRVERLVYERELSSSANERWVQALRNTLSPKQLRKVDEEYRNLIYEPGRQPKRDAEELSWEEIVSRFRWTFEGLANRSLVPVPFREIVLPPRTGWTLREDAVDWWASDEVANRIAEVRGERWVFRYESRKGIQQTAEMLWNLRGDGDSVVAIWLSAFLHDRERFGYDAFEFELVRSLEELMWSQKRYCHDWHHAMRNLAPWQLVSRLSSLLDIRSVSDIVELIAANAAMAAGYELIRFVEQPQIAIAE